METGTIELHGRLIGPWIRSPQALWRSTKGRPTGRTIAADLTDVTAIDDACRCLLRVMEAKSVTLAGGGIGIRAFFYDEQSLVFL